MPADLTIDELAGAAATTSRNVRAYQARGLLAPPRLVGRTGRYGDEHLARLRVIGRLRRRGWSLAAIADAVRAADRGAELSDLLGVVPPDAATVADGLERLVLEWAAPPGRARLALVPEPVAELLRAG